MQIEILIHTPLPAVNICLSTEGCTCYVMSILLKEYHKLQNIYLQKYDDKKIYILAFLSLGSAFMNAKKKKKKIRSLSIMIVLFCAGIDVVNEFRLLVFSKFLAAFWACQIRLCVCLSFVA